MTSRERRDPYVILGVARQATGKEIARAYRRAARASHPDSGDPGSPERFQAVSDAYEELRDPGRRALYDRSHPLAWPWTAGGGRGSVRYAAPGSQHLVLGESGPSRLVPESLPGDTEARSALELGDIGELLRLTVSLLRAGWGPQWSSRR